MEEAMNTPREFGPKGGICGSPMPEQGDPQVDTSYTGIIAQQAETIANLRTALEGVMPMLAECDCIYSNGEDMRCACRAARAAIEKVQP
jgi:hypothetical protein